MSARAFISLKVVMTFDALRVLVMETDDVSVLGQLEVGLDGIAPLLPGQLEGRQGVFR